MEHIPWPENKLSEEKQNDEQRDSSDEAKSRFPTARHLIRSRRDRLIDRRSDGQRRAVSLLACRSASRQTHRQTIGQPASHFRCPWTVSIILPVVDLSFRRGITSSRLGNRRYTYWYALRSQIKSNQINSTRSILPKWSVLTLTIIPLQGLNYWSSCSIESVLHAYKSFPP